MEMMTRRSFLKITGAMALAVGAAGALSGCDAVDNAVGSFFQQYGDQKGHAADSAGSFMYALSNRSRGWSYNGELALLAVEFQVKNLTNETVTFKASDITSAKIGSASQRLVTIRSILSDVVSFSFVCFLVTHCPIMEDM